MSLQTIEINSINITFDKEKTSSYQKECFSPCTCEGCRNFYKTIENNRELSDFLNEFGIDYNYTDEVFWYDMGKGDTLYFDSEGYYGVFGVFDGDEFSFEKFGVMISFLKTATVPIDRDSEYFYIRIKGDFPCVIDEDFPSRKTNLKETIKAIFKHK